MMLLMLIRHRRDQVVISYSYGPALKSHVSWTSFGFMSLVIRRAGYTFPRPLKIYRVTSPILFAQRCDEAEMIELCEEELRAPYRRSDDVINGV